LGRRGGGAAERSGAAGAHVAGGGRAGAACDAFANIRRILDGAPARVRESVGRAERLRRNSPCRRGGGGRSVDRNVIPTLAMSSSRRRPSGDRKPLEIRQNVITPLPLLSRGHNVELDRMGTVRRLMIGCVGLVA